MALNNEENNIELIISEDDLDDLTRNSIIANTKGKVVLGDENYDIKKKLFDSLPGVISKRIKEIIPDDFKLNEIEIKLLLSGTIFGAGIGGEVIVRLSPKSQK